MFSSAPKNPKEWLLDSAATDHFCNQREWFVSYKPLEGCEVAMGEGESKAEGIGEVLIEVGTHGKVNRFRLKEVIHTPRMRRNLISVRRLDNAGFTTIFGHSTTKVLYPDKGLAFEVPMKGKFYVLNAEIVADSDRQTEVDLSMSIGTSRKDIDIWHHRLGHLNESDLKYMSNQNLVRGMKPLKGTLETCIPCKLSKSTKMPHKKLEVIRSTEPLELVHSDLWGPSPVESLGGARYYVSFTDDCTRMVRVYTISKKNQAFDCFQDFKVHAEKATGKSIKALRTDNGLEFCAQYFKSFCQTAGIRHERTNEYSPSMNGVAERINRTLMDMVRAYLEDSNLPSNFWGELVRAAAYLKNRMKHSSISNGVPLALWIKHQPNVKHLKRLGCLAFVHIYKNHRNKLQRRANPGILVGYAIHTRGYRIWLPDSRKVVESKHVTFDEGKRGWDHFNAPDQAQIPRLELWNEPEDDHSESITEEVVPEPMLKEIIPEVVLAPIQDQADTKPPKGWSRQVEIRKSGKTKGMVDIYYITPDGKRLRSNNEVAKYKTEKEPLLNLDLFDYSRNNLTVIKAEETIDDVEANFTEVKIPRSFLEATRSPQSKEWQKAMGEELQMFEARDVTEVVPKPEGKKIIGSRWVYTTKKNECGDIIKYKARLVAQGFGQIEGVDYDETFSPVVNFTLIRLFLIIFIVKLKWIHHHFDVTCAYLYGPLDKDIYMKQPPGFETQDPHRFCLKLKKALYGLHQSGRRWFEELDQAFSDLGFKKLTGTNCIYYLPEGAVILVYVDDLAVMATNEKMVKQVYDLISTKFQIKDLGPMKKFLGIEVESNPSGGIEIHQRSYIEEVARRFNINCDEPVNVPLPVGAVLTNQDSPKTDKEKEQMSTIPYRSLIGCLLFIAQRTRPDILYTVTRLSQFNSNPGYSHWSRLCQLMRYILSTIDYNLKYNDNSNFEISAHSDSDWGGDRDNRRSDYGFVFRLGTSPFSWKASKQKSISLSSMESEYVALSETVRELVWLTPILEECSKVFGMKFKNVKVYCDNQSAIMFANNSIENTRSKHIDIRHHYVREKLKEAVFELKYVKSRENIADIFTKALSKDTLGNLVQLLTLN